MKKDRYEQVKFHFDSVLPADSSQYDLFRAVGKKTVKRFVQGVTVAVVTYGQAGVGKTYSLFGNAVARGSPGLVQQALEEIYTRLLRDKEQVGKVSLSALSIYQDKVTDLLNPKRTVKGDHVSLNSATSVDLQGVSHAMGVLAEYLLGRVISPAANPKVFGKPSRGHYILVLTLNKHGNPSQMTAAARQLARSHFFIVDLPGSERVKKSGVTGVYLEEAKSINHSLFVFSQCLHSERGRRPYRDSLLTLVLHPLFSTFHSEHSSEINLLALISGKEEDIEETISTLTFAQNSMNLRTGGEALPQRPKEEAVYLRNLVEERERQITDKDAKVLLKNAENEELRHQIEELADTVRKLKEKNEKLKGNLGQTTKSWKRAEEEKEDLTKTHRFALERRLKDEAEHLERQKEMEMTEFRIRTATEVSQAFASKVQKMTAEHEATVTKLMEALMEKQKQEQKLIALVHREQDENRRLRGELGHFRTGRRAGSAAFTSSSRPITPVAGSEESFRREIRPLELGDTRERTEEMQDAVAQTSENRFSSESADISPKALGSPQTSSSSSRLVSKRPDLESFRESPSSSLAEFSVDSLVPQGQSLLSTLQFALQRMQMRVTITKLDRKSRVKTRDIWLEDLQPFLSSDTANSGLWGQLLGAVTVAWSTTSRLKRKKTLRFQLNEMTELGLGQSSPGFARNAALQDRNNLSLWVKYRQSAYFEVIFTDRTTLVLWGSALQLAHVAINVPNPPSSAWQTQLLLLQQECGLPK